MIRLAMMSVAETSVIPMQDVLGLGSEARMNVPGGKGSYWRWRLLPGQIDRRLEQWLLETDGNVWQSKRQVRGEVCKSNRGKKFLIQVSSSISSLRDSDPRTLSALSFQGLGQGLPACQDGAGHPIKGAGELGDGRKAAIATADLPAAADITASRDRSVRVHIHQKPIVALPVV